MPGCASEISNRGERLGAAGGGAVAYSIFTVEGPQDPSGIIRFNSHFNRWMTLALFAATLWTMYFVPYHCAFHERVGYYTDSPHGLPTQWLVLNFCVDLFYVFGVVLRLFTSVCDLTYGKELTGTDRILDFLMRDPTFYCDLISILPLLIQPIPPAFALINFGDLDGNQSGGGTTGVTPFTTVAKILESLKLLRAYRLIFIPTSHLE